MRPESWSHGDSPARARLEWRIARRYLRSRRGSRSSLSLITLIAIGGVAVGVMALIVVLGVMNGLRDDLRERILVANPHLRILTYGAGLRLDDWRDALETIRRGPGGGRGRAGVLTQSLITAGPTMPRRSTCSASTPDTGRDVGHHAAAEASREGDLTLPADAPTAWTAASLLGVPPGRAGSVLSRRRRDAGSAQAGEGEPRPRRAASPSSGASR